ncbi:hypothetical protein NLG97_g9549 [Lecanicillium saksenae]|uniref:Uncharacterized protein n=1 Tax=Lecanicillium saksenae TaxID=468837 RepID=A0ACC1QI72_9HYPO|nr:hypothetical protein NLG97_g9549 [Lecanicillium saksenae]
MADRRCSNCVEILPRTSYSSNQWSKGEGASRCSTCVHGHHSDYDYCGDPNLNSGRYNLSRNSEVDSWELDNPFASGAFRWVAEGRYTSGPRSGQPAVHKWFKSGSVFSKDFFTLDIKAVDKALELVDRFNELGIVDKTIKINVPSVWTFIGGKRRGEKILVEPFIRNYQKFNSNTGWKNGGTGWPEVMQALSHCSYHISGGFYVLCDLQGGIYTREVVLSDPVILSRTRQYGVTDLGPGGIDSFFAEHRCNSYCRPHWTRPANPVAQFRPVSSTSMLRHHVPTGAGGHPSSAYSNTLTVGTIYEEEEDDYYDDYDDDDDDYW